MFPPPSLSSAIAGVGSSMAWLGQREYPRQPSTPCTVVNLPYSMLATALDPSTSKMHWPRRLGISPLVTFLFSMYGLKCENCNPVLRKILEKILAARFEKYFSTSNVPYFFRMLKRRCMVALKLFWLMPSGFCTIALFTMGVRKCLFP